MGTSDNEFTNTRTNWAGLDWKQAQAQLLALLSDYQFMRFEEVRLSKSKRADLVVVRNSGSEIIYGVIEVKSYRKISNSVKVKALDQVCRYLNLLYQQTWNSQKYGKLPKKYFAAVVFTHDYPSSFQSEVTGQHISVLDQKLAELSEVFVCTPENLVSSLLNKNMVGLKQQSLDDYY